MGGAKSKNVLYTEMVPDSEELEYSAILRNPGAHDLLIVPTVWGCDNYFALFM